MEFNQKVKHTINILPTTNNGFIVEVGCCRRAYTNTTQMMADLKEFLDNPKECELAYYSHSNTLHDVPRVHDPAPPIQGAGEVTANTNIDINTEQG